MKPGAGREDLALQTSPPAPSFHSGQAPLRNREGRSPHPESSHARSPSPKRRGEKPLLASLEEEAVLTGGDCFGGRRLAMTVTPPSLQTSPLAPSFHSGQAPLRNREGRSPHPCPSPEGRGDETWGWGGRPGTTDLTPSSFVPLRTGSSPKQRGEKPSPRIEPCSIALIPKGEGMKPGAQAGRPYTYTVA